jgi:predicted nucleotidyltransferase
LGIYAFFKRLRVKLMLLKTHVQMNLLPSHKKELIELCKKHQVKSLYAFGSVARLDFNEASDLDLMVVFKELAVKDYADNYYDFKFSLEDLFHRPIDLVEEKAIKNPYFKQVVDESKTLVYG